MKSSFINDTPPSNPKTQMHPRRKKRLPDIARKTLAAETGKGPLIFTAKTLQGVIKALKYVELLDEPRPRLILENVEYVDVGKAIYKTLQEMCVLHPHVIVPAYHPENDNPLTIAILLGSVIWDDYFRDPSLPLVISPNVCATIISRFLKKRDKEEKKLMIPRDWYIRKFSDIEMKKLFSIFSSKKEIDKHLFSLIFAYYLVAFGRQVKKGEFHPNQLANRVIKKEIAFLYTTLVEQEGHLHQYLLPDADKVTAETLLTDNPEQYPLVLRIAQPEFNPENKRLRYGFGLMLSIPHRREHGRFEHWMLTNFRKTLDPAFLPPIEQRVCKTLAEVIRPVSYSLLREKVSDLIVYVSKEVQPLPEKLSAHTLAFLLFCKYFQRQGRSHEGQVLERDDYLAIMADFNELLLSSSIECRQSFKIPKVHYLKDLFNLVTDDQKKLNLINFVGVFSHFFYAGYYDYQISTPNLKREHEILTGPIDRRPATRDFEERISYMAYHLLPVMDNSVNPVWYYGDKHSARECTMLLNERKSDPHLRIPFIIRPVLRSTTTNQDDFESTQLDLGCFSLRDMPVLTSGYKSAVDEMKEQKTNSITLLCRRNNILCMLDRNSYVQTNLALALNMEFKDELEDIRPPTDAVLREHLARLLDAKELKMEETKHAEIKITPFLSKSRLANLPLLRNFLGEKPKSLITSLSLLGHLLWVKYMHLHPEKATKRCLSVEDCVSLIQNIFYKLVYSRSLECRCCFTLLKTEDLKKLIILKSHRSELTEAQFVSMFAYLAHTNGEKLTSLLKDDRPSTVALTKAINLFYREFIVHESPCWEWFQSIVSREGEHYMLKQFSLHSDPLVVPPAILWISLPSETETKLPALLSIQCATRRASTLTRREETKGELGIPIYTRMLANQEGFINEDGRLDHSIRTFEASFQKELKLDLERRINVYQEKEEEKKKDLSYFTTPLSSMIRAKISIEPQWKHELKLPFEASKRLGIILFEEYSRAQNKPPQRMFLYLKDFITIMQNFYDWLKTLPTEYKRCFKIIRDPEDLKKLFISIAGKEERLAVREFVIAFLYFPYLNGNSHISENECIDFDAINLRYDNRPDTLRFIGHIRLVYKAISSNAKFKKFWHSMSDRNSIENTLKAYNAIPTLCDEYMFFLLRLALPNVALLNKGVDPEFMVVCSTYKPLLTESERKTEESHVVITDWIPSRGSRFLTRNSYITPDIEYALKIELEEHEKFMEEKYANFFMKHLFLLINQLDISDEEKHALSQRKTRADRIIISLSIFVTKMVRRRYASSSSYSQILNIQQCQTIVEHLYNILRGSPEWMACFKFIPQEDLEQFFRMMSDPKKKHTLTERQFARIFICLIAKENFGPNICSHVDLARFTFDRRQDTQDFITSIRTFMIKFEELKFCFAPNIQSFEQMEAEFMGSTKEQLSFYLWFPSVLRNGRLNTGLELMFSYCKLPSGSGCHHIPVRIVDVSTPNKIPGVGIDAVPMLIFNCQLLAMIESLLEEKGREPKQPVPPDVLTITEDPSHRLDFIGECLYKQCLSGREEKTVSIDDCTTMIQRFYGLKTPLTLLLFKMIGLDDLKGLFSLTVKNSRAVTQREFQHIIRFLILEEPLSTEEKFDADTRPSTRELISRIRMLHNHFSGEEKCESKSVSLFQGLSSEEEITKLFHAHRETMKDSVIRWIAPVTYQSGKLNLNPKLNVMMSYFNQDVVVCHTSLFPDKKEEAIKAPTLSPSVLTTTSATTTSSPSTLFRPVVTTTTTTTATPAPLR